MPSARKMLQRRRAERVWERRAYDQGETVDFNDPFRARSYDPTTGKATLADVAREQEAQATAGRPDVHVFDGEYAWDNLSAQERAIWASVFGMAYVHGANSMVDNAYARARMLACKAIDDHRRHGA